MATFKPTVQKIRADKTYLVYIRVTNSLRQVGYIKTDKYIFQDKVKNGEIKDEDILGYCWEKIREFNKKLNKQDETDKWNVKDIIDFVSADKNGISFTDYCDKWKKR
ncbi:hypothetical protein [Prevotella sp. 10(H)]|uniref:hypothetical protein n=1 Tax=Prevotella sp. 10(H) TaxID=1158294 RepID=UPI0004A702B0|nr:hypothetical protein [Prevotella sp. 10(H)]